MVLTVFVLAILALLVAVAAAMGRAPIWVAVILLAVLEILRALPLR
jgi:hypothetical protein